MAALISSGASSLGWGTGDAIGATLAGKADPSQARDLTTLIVGDGSFIFGVPSAAYWMARRYDTVSLEGWTRSLINQSLRRSQPISPRSPS